MASWGKRTLIGCGIGCGSLILFAILLVVGFNIWLNRPGTLLEPEVLMDEETTGYVEWTLQLDDPGTAGFVERLLEELQELPDGTEELPGWFQGWFRRLQEREAEKDVHDLFPMVVAWTLRPDSAEAGDAHLLTVSLERMGNQLVFGDWILGWVIGWSSEGSVRRFDGEKIYHLEIDERTALAFFIRGNDVFLTSDVASAERAVERLRDATPSTGANELGPRFEETAGGGPLRGALTNRGGEVSRIWAALAGDDAPDAERWAVLRGATLSGGLEDDGSLAGRLELLCPDERWAGEEADALAASLAERIPPEIGTFEIEATAVGDRVRIEFRVPELTSRLGDLMQHGMELEGGGRVKVDF